MIVGILGKKGHGKDTVGGFLKAYGFETVSFAQPLKRAAKIIFGLTESQVNGSIEEKEAVDPAWGKSPRELLQLLGTEVGRSIDSEVWIKSCFNKLDPNKRWAITDVRFPNEAAAIKERGGIIIKVVRDGFDSGSRNEHASESQIDQIPCDYLLTNYGSLDDLRSQVQDVCLLMGLKLSLFERIKIWLSTLLKKGK